LCVLMNARMSSREGRGLGFFFKMTAK